MDLYHWTRRIDRFEDREWRKTIKFSSKTHCTSVRVFYITAVEWLDDHFRSYAFFNWTQFFVLMCKLSICGKILNFILHTDNLRSRGDQKNIERKNWNTTNSRACYLPFRDKPFLRYSLTFDKSKLLNSRTGITTRRHSTCT